MVCGILSCCCCCCSNITRAFLIVMNVLFAKIGLVLLVMGAVMKFAGTKKLMQMASSVTGTVSKFSNFDLSNLSRLLGGASKYIDNIGFVFMAMGMFILIVSIIGLCGAGCRCRVALKLYLVIVSVLALIMIALTVVLAKKRDAVRDSGEKFFLRKFETHYKNKQKFHRVFNNLMHIFQCCGIVNGTDFFRYDSGLNDSIPMECCKDGSICPTSAKDAQTIPLGPQAGALDWGKTNFNLGCFTMVWNVLERYIKKVLIGFIVLDFLLILFVISTALVLRHENKLAKKRNG